MDSSAFDDSYQQTTFDTNAGEKRSFKNRASRFCKKFLLAIITIGLVALLVLQIITIATTS